MRPVAFAAPSGWQMAAVQLELLQIDPGRREVFTRFQSIPLELRSAPAPCRSTAHRSSALTRESSTITTSVPIEPKGRAYSSLKTHFPFFMTTPSPVSPG